MSKSMRTIVLQIYKPSRIKKIILDEAMLNYSKAFQYLLDKAYEEIENISEVYKDRSGTYRAQCLSKWIDKKLAQELNAFQVEPFKDSIKLDFASALSGYLNLKAKGKNVNYPSTYLDSEKIEEEYEKLMSQCDDENINYNELEHKIDKLINKAGKYRAIFFCRYSTKRNYSLLYDPQSNRYYAKIYLMNVKNEKRKQLNASIDKTLMYISKKKELFRERNNKKTFLLLPLSFGKWQESFIKRMRNNPDIIKTARLVKKKDKYYLSINFISEMICPVKTENYMGVCRGIENGLNYSVVDKEGTLLSEGHIDIEKRNINRNNMYKLANSIVSTALNNGCTIVMEKFLIGGDGISFPGDKNSKPVMGCADYNELFKIVKYKAQGKGLPPPIRVSSFGIFYKCPRCGANSKANRFSGKIMICTQCGITMGTERLGSLNLSKKPIKYSNDAIIIKAQNTKEGIKFVNNELDMEFYPKDPFDCAHEFIEKIDEIINNFYDNITYESEKINFKKKYSLIKKLEQHKDIFDIIRIE